MASPAPETPAQRTVRRAALALTFLFVLAAVGISTGLVVYAAWLHHLKDGLFAVLFAVLSAKAVLSWLAWRDQAAGHQPSVGGQQK